MPRHDDNSLALPPKRRGWVAPTLVIVALGAAGGAGYGAWKFRRENKAAQQELGRLRGEHQTSADALGVQKALASDLDGQLTICKTELTSQTSELGETKTQLESLEKESAQTKEMLDELKSMTARFQKMIDAGKLDVSIRRGKMVVKLPEAILFPSGSADLSKEGKEAIGEVAQVLKKIGNRRLTIAGHSDNIRVSGGKFASNWELSAARAVSVTEVLVAKGVRARNLVAAGFGEHDPVASNGSKDGRQKNRRIEIILEPDLSKAKAAVAAAAAAKNKDKSKAAPAKETAKAAAKAPTPEAKK
jgi:chemotaxis protein MotB